RGVRPPAGGPRAPAQLSVALCLVRAFRSAGVFDATRGRIDRRDYRVGAADDAIVADVAGAGAAGPGFRGKPAVVREPDQQSVLLNHSTPNHSTIIASSHRGSVPNHPRRGLKTTRGSSGNSPIGGIRTVGMLG